MRGTWIALVLILLTSTAHAQEEACRSQRLEAERLQAARAHVDAANLYVRIAREQPSCPRLDEVLYNAAINYDAARLSGRAIRVREILIRQFPRSSLLPRALFQQASAYHAMAMYAQAAAGYEDFARRYPAEVGESCDEDERARSRCPDSVVALQNAIFFRLGLGDREAANADAALFVRNYGRSRPSLAASIAFGLAVVPYETGRGDAEPAAARADEFLRLHGGAARLDERARALVVLGRAQLARSRPEDAAAAFERVVAIVTPDAIGGLRGAEHDVAYYRVRAHAALAEAQLRLTELRPVALEAPPRYRGPRTESGLRAWAEGPLMAWRDRRVAALEPLREAHARVLEHQIPEQSIAALERTAALYARTWREGEAAVPEWAREDEGLASALERLRGDVLEPVRARALASYEACANMARVVRWFTERSMECEDGLVALDPARYSTPHELTGEPSYRRDVVAAPAPALTEATTGTRRALATASPRRR